MKFDFMSPETKRQGTPNIGKNVKQPECSYIIDKSVK